MERLTSPYQKSKLTPVEMLLQRLKQSQIEQEKETVQEKLDLQYNMFVADNRKFMMNRLHNNKITNKLSSISSKIQPVEHVSKGNVIKVKTDNEFRHEAEIEYNNHIKQKNKDCFNGDKNACNYVNNFNLNKKDIIDKISKRLTNEHNKKASEFNNKIKSQTKKNPLTTGDFIINPETNRIIKNPIVTKLEQQQKLKDLTEMRKESVAYKKGQEMKKIEAKMFKPQKVIKIGFNTADVPGTFTI